MADYTLYYWPIPFRGEFIRAVLCFAGQSYNEPPMDDVVALKSRAPDAQPSPFMAPPLLIDHAAGLSLSQMPAILRYLGDTHGLMPPDPAQAALTDKVIGDANDVLDELTRFGGRSMWTLGEWETFLEDRLTRWMAIFEVQCGRAGVRADGGYLSGGDAPGLSDLVTAVLWGVMTAKLTPLQHLLAEVAPLVTGLSARVLHLPPLAALRRQSDARYGDLYCGGEIEASIRDMLSRNRN